MSKSARPARRPEPTALEERVGTDLRPAPKLSMCPNLAVSIVDKQLFGRLVTMGYGAASTFA